MIVLTFLNANDLRVIGTTLQTRLSSLKTEILVKHHNKTDFDLTT